MLPFKHSTEQVDLFNDVRLNQNCPHIIDKNYVKRKEIERHLPAYYS